MRIHLFFIFVALIKCAICAKKFAHAAKYAGTYLRHRGGEEMSRTTQKNHLHVNNINASRSSVVTASHFKSNLFINKNYAKECFIKNYDQVVRIVQFRRFNKLWAKKKGVGSTKNGRDSNPKNLGVKVLGNNFAHAGNIIVRQRGRTFKPGHGVKQGRDFTLIATKPGRVHFFNRVVSIVDVSDPKPMTYTDVYREDPTILTLSRVWTSAK
ncbi:50S ribosomal protein L27 [Plasmodium cynomolgi strain B]|uniref:50S ribosomal protein L27 n=1 Tax=Plasmodium cynomolgi (strain B) TaxID=1120755 RepID=K6UJ35_PLACD|nr:50S ribosomal protein L27 [Plasmodium cynomolgi strain B]GAB65553.1 50S ribosomal protein L27 [Plasmodium cynomolgi strain B]